MTVAQLREKLSEFDDDMEVRYLKNKFLETAEIEQIEAGHIDDEDNFVNYNDKGQGYDKPILLLS